MPCLYVDQSSVKYKKTPEPTLRSNHFLLVVVALVVVVLVVLVLVVEVFIVEAGAVLLLAPEPGLVVELAAGPEVVLDAAPEVVVAAAPEEVVVVVVVLDPVAAAGVLEWVTQ